MEKINSTKKISCSLEGVSWEIGYGKYTAEERLLASFFRFCYKAEELIISSFTATSPRQYGLSSRGIFQVILDKNDGMKGLFSFAFKKKMSKQVYNLWISGVVSAIWLVWKLRNLVIF